MTWVALVLSGKGVQSCTWWPVSAALCMRFHSELVRWLLTTPARAAMCGLCVRAPQTMSGARARRASWRLPPRRCTARAGRPPAWRTALGAASTMLSAAAGRASGDEYSIGRETASQNVEVLPWSVCYGGWSDNVRAICWIESEVLVLLDMQRAINTPTTAVPSKARGEDCPKVCNPAFCRLTFKIQNDGGRLVVCDSVNVHALSQILEDHSQCIREVAAAGTYRNM